MNRLAPNLHPRWDEHVRTELAKAAQTVYDAWEQVDGVDPELGEGGICQDVASGMVETLSREGIEHALSIAASVGENHVFVVALIPGDGVYSIDIPPSVYEIGSGYVWRKREGVAFGPDDIVVDRIADDMTPEDFETAYCE